MNTRTERHTFRDLPINLGGEVVFRISGECMWRVGDDGTLLVCNDVMLKGENGALVGVGDYGSALDLVYAALEQDAKNYGARSSRGDELPLSSTPYNPKAPGDLDNAMTEGAGSTP